MNAFSPEFEKLIHDAQAFREVMKYSCMGEFAPYQAWEDRRRFIAGAINNDGTIFDVGCAGGLFLMSLKEWSGFNLIPYGIDINEEYVREAKNLFPKYANNFSVLNVGNIEKLPETHLPLHYDFVYISIMDLHKIENIDFIQKHILPLAKKRLIIGFYAPNKFSVGTPEWQEEREYVRQGIENLKQSNIGINGSIFNSTQFNHAFAWKDVG